MTRGMLTRFSSQPGGWLGHARATARDLVDDMMSKGVVEEFLESLVCTNCTRNEKGWFHKVLCGLPEVKRYYSEGSVSFASNRRYTLDALGGARYFSTLDLCSGYHQLPVAREDKEKTAFSTPDGHYQFTVMPFGVCNGPSSFQRLMGIVLKGLQWHGCLVYLDDIIVYGRTFQEHLERLTAVFERLESAGLRLKPSKCHLLRRNVEFSGSCCLS